MTLPMLPMPSLPAHWSLRSAAPRALYAPGAGPRPVLGLLVAAVTLCTGCAAAAATAAAAVSPAPIQVAVDTGQRSEGLPALLLRVLPQDPQVRVAESLHQAAEQRRLQARSRLGPVVGVSATYGQSLDTEFGLERDRTTERAEASVRWNVYNQGNDLAEFRAATREVMAAAQELRRAREEAAERVSSAYLDLQRLDELLPRASERLDALRRIGGQVGRQLAAGKAAEADFQQAEASVLDAEIVYEQLAADRAGAVQRLSVLIGGPAPLTQPVTLPQTAPEAPPRPGEVDAAQARADAARERVRPGASVWAPRLDVEYRQRLSDRTTPALTTEQQHGWTAVARWDMPVMGELQARRAEVQHRAEAAQAEADRVERAVLAELQALGPRIRQSQRAVAVLEEQRARYDELVRAGELQYEAGRRTLAQLMGLHDGRFNVEQRRSEQAFRLSTARLRRLTLTGELLPSLVPSLAGLAAVQPPAGRPAGR